jgi:hypothetical protein
MEKINKSREEQRQKMPMKEQRQKMPRREPKFSTKGWARQREKKKERRTRKKR